jgi:metal-sulfur cluster biosynthetic enzyme
MFDSTSPAPRGDGGRSLSPDADPSIGSGEDDASNESGSDAERAVPTTTDDPSSLTQDQVKLALRRVKDPELNLNIVDLGLIYDIHVEGSDVRVDMSLTSPGCPSGPEIMGEAEKQLQSIPGVGSVAVNLVWTPPWTPERIEPRVRAYMGF